MTKQKDFKDDMEVSTEEFMTWFGLALGALLASAFLFWLGKRFIKDFTPEGTEMLDAQPPPGRPQRGGLGNRRQAAVRNRRGGGRRVDDSDSEGDGGDGDVAATQRAQLSDDELEEKLNDPKLGAKKRAKLEAKAEKRAQREAEERMREEKKAKQAAEMKERELREQQEAEAEKRKEEEEKRAREEKAKQELEEYMKMKEMFTVEGEGCEAGEEEDEENILEKFVQHVRDKKVILFEELAAQFGLKVPEAIDRLKTLVQEGRLTGVMDDRGKFIYISEAELSKFAKFIKQRGRVSIADLVENSSSLITLVAEMRDTPSV